MMFATSTGLSSTSSVWSAAFPNQRAASSRSRGAPVPSWYMRPRVGGFSIPEYGLCRVRLHSQAAPVGLAELELRLRVSLHSRLPQGGDVPFGLDWRRRAFRLLSLHGWQRTSVNHEGSKQQDEHVSHAEILQPCPILHKCRTELEPGQAVAFSGFRTTPQDADGDCAATCCQKAPDQTTSRRGGEIPAGVAPREVDNS